MLTNKIPTHCQQQQSESKTGNKPTETRAQKHSSIVLQLASAKAKRWTEAKVPICAALEVAKTGGVVLKY